MRINYNLILVRYRWLVSKGGKFRPFLVCTSIIILITGLYALICPENKCPKFILSSVNKKGLYHAQRFTFTKL